MEKTYVLRKLEALVATIHYRLVPANVTCCRTKDKTILLNRRKSKENQIYALAHEIGHARTLKQCDCDFGYLLNDKTERSYPVKESELRAWNVADGLMKKYGLYGRNYLKYKHARIGTYYYY